MPDFNLVGPVIGILTIVDVLIHLRLDLAKVLRTTGSAFTEPSTHIPPKIMIGVVISTLLSFALVLFLPLAWMVGIGASIFQAMIPLFDPSVFVWGFGFILLIFGILLHIWSREVRQDMATSWAMSQEHVLITKGPYSKIRHPSYTSYFLCFIGLFLLLPSVVSLFLFLGFPSYYLATLYEEEYLISQFGETYHDYKEETGRFFPFL